MVRSFNLKFNSKLWIFRGFCNMFFNQRINFHEAPATMRTGGQKFLNFRR